MSNERKQILEMLAEGKITADEASRLLDAIEKNAAEVSEQAGSVKKPKFLHVQVTGREGSKHENVNIKIPIMILKAGMKLGSFMPDEAKAKVTSHLGEHGINLDLSKLESKDIDVLVAALAETSIDVDADNEKVRIYCA
jgi:ABC-type Fe3+-hydroxamate transport system substrate-binding protein